VLVAEVGQVVGKASSAPHELKVSGLVHIGEGLKDAPPALDDVMVVTAVRVGGNRLQSFNVDRLLATGSDLNLFRGDEREGEDGEGTVDTLLDLLELLGSLIESGLDHEFDVLIHVLLRHLLGCTAGAQRHGLSTGQNCHKLFVNDGFEFLIRERFTVVLEILEDLEGVSVNLLQVLKGELFANDLLPEGGWQVDRQGRLRADGKAKDTSEEFEQLHLGRASCLRVENVAIAVCAVFIAVVGTLDNQGEDAFFQFGANVDERVSEGTTVVHGSFAEELNYPASFVRRGVRKVVVRRVVLLDLLVALAENGVLSFVVHFTGVGETSCLDTLATNVGAGA